MSFPELWTSVMTVFQYTLFEINRTPVTLMSLILVLLAFLAFGLISRLLRRYLLNRVFKYLQLEEGTRYTFSRIIHYLVMVVGAVFSFQFVGIDLSGLAVIFGFLSVGVGFGLQNVTSNFVAGLILLFERPIQIGDRVTVGETVGDVEEINIRSTTVRSESNISIIVPNSEFISSTVVNWSHGDQKTLLQVAVGVAYDSDLDLVLRVLEEVARANKDILQEPAPQVHLSNFGDSSWDMHLRVWVADPKKIRQVRSDLHCAIVRSFREHKIEIPFPQRDLHLRSPLPVPLAGQGTQSLAS